MCRTIARVVILGTALLPACWSQIQPPSLDFARSAAEGIHLYGISTFFGYSTYNFPRTAGQNNVSSEPTKRYGVLGTLGWQRLHGRANFSVRYSGSYQESIRQSNLTGLNHNLVVGFARPLGNKWSLDIAANGQDASFEQFIFQPSTLGSTSQAAASFDNVAAAMSVGQFTDPQSGVLLNGSPSVSPLTAVLLGSHILTYAMHTGLSYAPSTRLSFQLSSFALGGQYRTGENISGFQQNYILPRTIGGDAGISMHFSLSPRTQLDGSVMQNYVSSRYQKASGTSINAGFGRKMGRNWFLRAYVGGYLTENVRQDGGTPMTRQTIGGASLGFRTYATTLLASYNRSGYDVNSGGLAGTTTISAAWNWRQPRRNWGLNSTYMQVESTSPGFSSLSGWHAAIGFSERLKGNLLLNLTYTHLSSQGVYLLLANRITVDGFRISLGWAPHLRERGGNGPAELQAPEP